MFAITRSSMPGSASISGMLGGRSTRTLPARDGAQGTRDDLIPAHGFEQGIDGIRRDPGHVQQIADQRVQPVRTLLYRSQQLLLLFLGEMDVVVPKPADGQLDPGQGRAQVVRNGAEDGRAHRVALGQAQHLAPAGHQLLAFQLGRQMNAERPEEAPVACRQDPSEQHQARGGVDFFDVVAGGIRSRPASGQGWNFPTAAWRCHSPVRTRAAVAVREAVAQAEKSSHRGPGRHSWPVRATTGPCPPSRRPRA